MALGEPRQVCPECGHAIITTSQGRHAPRCIRAACRYVGPGVPLDLDTRAREARAWVTSCRSVVEDAQRELAAAEEVLAAIEAEQQTSRLYVPLTGQWWEPTDDPLYYRAVEPCDEGCHHPVHALGHPERRRHLERAEFIESAADRGVTPSGT